MEDRTRPHRVVGLTATPGDGSAVLTWTASEDAGGIAGYEIYRDGRYVVTITSTTFTDPALTNGVAHQYRVFAVDMARNISKPSGTVWALPKLLPDTQPRRSRRAHRDGGSHCAQRHAELDAAARQQGCRQLPRVPRRRARGHEHHADVHRSSTASHKTEYQYAVVALDAAGNLSAATPAVSTYVS